MSTFEMMFQGEADVPIESGADLGFSRGGGGFSKKNSKILTTFFFFRSTKLIFRALPKQCFPLILAKFSAPQANF